MAEESGTLEARIEKQRSLSAVNGSTGLRCCCIAGPGGRRGRSLAECEFQEMFGHCKGFLSVCCGFHGGRGAHDHHEEAISTRMNNEYAGNEEDDEHPLPYKTPSRFRLFCRKLKAEARRNMRWPINMSAATSRFHYDALSYAMNFDDGTVLQQAHISSTSCASSQD